MGKLATAIFLKGYQWPFDPRKVQHYGSSMIDVLVYQETGVKGRRVFLDFLRNPSRAGRHQDCSFDLLGDEAYQYLEKSEGLLGTPIERLKKMNQPAIDLYKQHDIDITQEVLEIAVCAQHNNGGLKGNIWWESDIRHLFPVGEVNGTHGVYRPGGSALNSGQVGSMRAALYISKRYGARPLDRETFLKTVEVQINGKFDLARRSIDGGIQDDDRLNTMKAEIQERMSSCGAHIRHRAKVEEAVEEAWSLYDNMKNEMRVPSKIDLPALFKNLDLCLTHILYLEAILAYLQKGGKSRGSYLVTDPSGLKPCAELTDEWKFGLNEKDAFVNQKILEITLDDDKHVRKAWVDIRPIPKSDLWFENVWNLFLKDDIVKNF